MFSARFLTKSFRFEIYKYNLAPFCALFNNIFEIRLDARKYTKLLRRPNPERVSCIGIWYKMFRFLAYLAIVTNVRFRGKDIFM